MRLPRTALLIPFLPAALLGCPQSSSAPGPTSASNTASSQPVPAPSAEPTTCSDTKLTLTTEDGVALVADRYGQAAGRPGIVLLHMIPPHHDRSGYPADFIQALTKAGYTVLNVDRRGAGESKGEPKDAYEGDKGVLDAKAAVKELREGPCKVSSVALIGASNGTTTALDYAVASSSDPAWPVPASLVFLTGGKYTEKQHALADVRAKLTMPILFAFSTEERAWSAAQQKGAPASWTFREYQKGAHGTKMFDVVPSITSDLVGFLKGQAAAPGDDTYVEENARWDGSWHNDRCGAREYRRELKILEGKVTGRDLVSPCPPKVACVWSGIAEWTATAEEKGDKLILTIDKNDHPKAVKPLPTELTWDAAAKAPREAPDCVYSPPD